MLTRERGGESFDGPLFFRLVLLRQISGRVIRARQGGRVKSMNYSGGEVSSLTFFPYVYMPDSHRLDSCI